MSRKKRHPHGQGRKPFGAAGQIVAPSKNDLPADPDVKVIQLEHGTIELSPVPPDIQQAIHEILVRRGLAADDSPKVRGAFRQAIHDFLVKRGLASPDPEPAAPAPH